MAITGVAKALCYAGLCAFVMGGLSAMLPWKSRRLSSASIQRRIYWAGTIAGALLLFVGVLPDWRSALFVSACTILVLVVLAYRFTSHIKIRGRIYEFMRDPRQPDPPPALRSDGE
jgi:MFS family permease